VGSARRELLLALLLAFALALLTSGAVRAIPARAPVDELSLEQQVGRLILLSFPGTMPPPYVREALRERRVAGVILFRGNVTGPAELRALTAQLRRDGGRPIVAVDQEGGDIRILPWAPPHASPPRQATLGTVRRAAETAARVLRAAGITVTLAPVADVPSVQRAALKARAFSSAPGTASQAVRSAVVGWQAGGIASTAKHFPGLGGANVNTDVASVTVRRTRAQLERIDLPPFEAAIRAGVPLVMIGHARYPALDPDNVASQSPAIIGGLLRQSLGFRGVVITDSMEAHASLATGDITTVSERAVRAGADLVLLTGKGSYMPVYQHLRAVAQRSATFRARVRESAARVLALTQR
jgi:beta-N-acetylhexosaminidase